MRRVACIIAILCFAFRGATQELLPGGNFSTLDEKGWVKGWPRGRSAKILSLPGGERILEVNGKRGSGVDFTLPLRPEWGVLTLETEMKTDRVVLGKDPWCTARIAMRFLDSNKKQAGTWPEVFGAVGTTGWTICKRDYLIPAGASTLCIQFCNLGESGTVWFRPISLRVKRNRAVKGENLPLPEGYASQDPWRLEDAWREQNQSRARYCLNGLWRFRPVLKGERFPSPPAEKDLWGWGKIPGLWHPIGAHDPTQRFYFSYWLEDHPPADRSYDQAWYRRTVTIPAFAKGRRARLDLSLVQTHAGVWIDRKYAGEVWYPGGTVEITRWLQPGKKQQIDLLVTARPIDPIANRFLTDQEIVKKKADVNRKGLTGDLFLDLLPIGGEIRSSTITCSTTENTITFTAEISSAEKGPFRLVADVKGCGETKRFESEKLLPDADGYLRMTAPWPDAKRWDIHTPQNRYAATLSLSDGEGRLLDTSLPISFGFREIRRVGRDLQLNNIPLHLRAIRNTNINGSAAGACRESVLAKFSFYKRYGFNFVITSNYGFQPGRVSYLEDFLDVCDETGMLVALSLPHIRDFGSALQKPEVAERYRAQTRWLIEKTRHHPSVILYAMNHNSCGYPGMQNPQLIDGIFDMPKTGSHWWVRAREQARLSEKIVKEIDPTRLVYHHNGANLGDLYSINIYLNWSPIQERSDWLRHWHEKGTKPLFFVEWGLPHISSWSSYRGPHFIWRTPAFQSLWAAEYAAQFWGDAAYEDSPAAQAALAQEERLWAKGEPFAWGRLCHSLRSMTNQYQKVQALFATDNWRCHRGWGATAMLPWDQEDFLKKVSPLRNPENPHAAEKLKRPGIVPDLLDASCVGAEKVFVPTSIGEVFTRWNLEDCAFIGGDPEFTDKRHLFHPGEKFTKRLVLINDRRVPQEIHWRCAVRGSGETREGTTLVAPGTVKQVPVTFTASQRGGDDLLQAEFTFAGNLRQRDSFALTVLPEETRKPSETVWLYDPKGVSAKDLKRLGIRFTPSTLASFPNKGTLVIGRGALPPDLITRSLPAVKNGLRILILEQEGPQLEAIGFRVAEHGLRRLFPRYTDPALPDLRAEELRDWSGSSTLLPASLQDLQAYETHVPWKKWCGLNSSRVWRCGHRGAVASVLPEKPTAGDWRALADGGFDLQYAPLLKWNVGYGFFLFCQLDVSGRTVPDPVADRILCRLFDLRPSPSFKCIEPHGIAATHHCMAQRVVYQQVQAWKSEVWLISSGIRPPADHVREIEQGKTVLCFGLSAEEVKAWSPVPVSVEEKKGVFFDRIEKLPQELNGLSNADWAWHGTMDFAAFTDPSDEGNRAIRVIRYGKGRVIFWQVPPWKIDAEKRPYLRTSRRRAEVMFARLISNVGGYFDVDHVRYQDIPQRRDDPYQYYPW